MKSLASKFGGTVQVKPPSHLKGRKGSDAESVSLKGFQVPKTNENPSSSNTRDVTAVEKPVSTASNTRKSSSANVGSESAAEMSTDTTKVMI